jgi:hypothetical protein
MCVEFPDCCGLRRSHNSARSDVQFELSFGGLHSSHASRNACMHFIDQATNRGSQKCQVAHELQLGAYSPACSCFVAQMTCCVVTSGHSLQGLPQRPTGSVFWRCIFTTAMQCNACAGQPLTVRTWWYKLVERNEGGP